MEQDSGAHQEASEADYKAQLAKGKIMKDDTSIKRGSKNLFADLGYAAPETHLLKAGLVTQLRKIIGKSSLTQTEAAGRIGLSQPDVSRLLRGQFRDVSVERLIRMLTKLGST